MKHDAVFCFSGREIDALKNSVPQKPVLKIFHQHETELRSDASIDGFGAVLLKKSPKENQVHAVYYISKKTTDADIKFSSYELEILAVRLS